MSKKKTTYAVVDRENWSCTPLDWRDVPEQFIFDCPGELIYDVPMITPSGDIEIGSFVYIESDINTDEYIEMWGEIKEVNDGEYCYLIPVL